MKQLTIGFLLSLVCACLLQPSPAQAQTSPSYSSSLALTATDWSHAFVLPQFNLPQSTLTAVSIQVDYNLHTSGNILNRAQIAEYFDATLNSQLSLTLPGTSASLQSQPLNAEVADTIGPNGTLGFGPFDSSTSAHLILSDPADLAAFVGSGNVSLLATTSTDEQVLGGGNNVSLALNTLGGATVSITYNYSLVPEPSTGGLAVMGLGALLAFARRARGRAA